MPENTDKNYKMISLRIPKEMLDRIDINAKNTRGYNRTTWILQAMDQHLKHPDNISIPHKPTIDSTYDPITLDKKMFMTYAKDMKKLYNLHLTKIILIFFLAAGVAGCVGASLASGASIWSFTSGVAGHSKTAEKLADNERQLIKEEIKHELTHELFGRPCEIIEIIPEVQQQPAPLMNDIEPAIAE